MSMGPRQHNEAYPKSKWYAAWADRRSTQTGQHWEATRTLLHNRLANQWPFWPTQVARFTRSMQVFRMHTPAGLVSLEGLGVLMQGSSGQLAVGENALVGAHSERIRLSQPPFVPQQAACKTKERTPGQSARLPRWLYQPDLAHIE